jgi:hypothetical protein
LDHPVQSRPCAAPFTFNDSTLSRPANRRERFFSELLDLPLTFAGGAPIMLM